VAWDSPFAADAVEAMRGCMSAVARKRTNTRSSRYVRLVPKADSCTAANSHHSITSSAMASSIGGTSRAQCLSGRQVDDKFELGRLLHGEIRSSGLSPSSPTAHHRPGCLGCGSCDGTDKTGSTSVEAGIAEMNDRMLGGRWKVFRGLNDGWLEEYRLYHRDTDGKIVKKSDDAISARQIRFDDAARRKDR
jgi:hypothetical protein